MATIRHDARINRSADAVWKAVSDAGSIAEWFPAIEESTAEGSTRRCTLHGGGDLVEEIITNDDRLRRFQYRITGGALAPSFHLGTIDVLEADDGGALVVYSTEIDDELHEMMDGTLAQGLEGLKQHLEA